MSKIEYEYELVATLGPHHASATEIKVRSRPVSDWVARRMEVARRKLRYSIENGQLLWRYVDTGELVNEQATATLNGLMDAHYKELRVESTIRKAAVGVATSKWYKNG